MKAWGWARKSKWARSEGTTRTPCDPGWRTSWRGTAGTLGCRSRARWSRPGTCRSRRCPTHLGRCRGRRWCTRASPSATWSPAGTSGTAPCCPPGVGTCRSSMACIGPSRCLVESSRARRGSSRREKGRSGGSRLAIPVRSAQRCQPSTSHKFGTGPWDQKYPTLRMCQTRLTMLRHSRRDIERTKCCRRDSLRWRRCKCR
jgi:hypothetical protein